MDFYQTSPPQSSTNKIWVYSTGNHYYNKKNEDCYKQFTVAHCRSKLCYNKFKLFLKLHLNSYTFCDLLGVIQ